MGVASGGRSPNEQALKTRLRDWSAGDESGEWIVADHFYAEPTRPSG